MTLRELSQGMDGTGQLCRNPRACSPRADHAHYRSGCRGKYTTLDCPGLSAWAWFIFRKKKKKKSSEHLDYLFQTPVSLGQDFQLLSSIFRPSTVIPRLTLCIASTCLSSCVLMSKPERATKNSSSVSHQEATTSRRRNCNWTSGRTALNLLGEAGTRKD